MSRITFTRREVLGAGLGVAASALAIGTFGLGAIGRSGRPLHLIEATYRPLVGDAFTVDIPGRLDLILAGIRGLGPLRHGAAVHTGSENFALEFTAKAGLPSGVQTVWHPAIGQFPLFISPVGQSGPVQRSEAIVNTYDMNIRRRIDV